MSLMPDGMIDLVVTSPPYFNAKDYSKYQNYQSYLDIMKEICVGIFRILKAGRFFCINTSPVLTQRESRQHASTRHPIPFDLNHIIQTLGFEFIDEIVWVKPEASVKNRIGGFMQHRRPLAWKPNAVTEYIFVYRKKSGKLIDHNISQYDKDIINASLIKEFETTNVWKIPPTRNKSHPAPFPDQLVSNLIRFYSFVGDVVYDPFAGSGTTLKQAMILNRNYIGSEISAKYCDIIRTRLC